MNCPDANSIVALLEGNLPAIRRTAVLGHLDGCDECLALVAGVTKRTEGGEPARAVETKALSPGTAIGRYLLVEIVGSGGMGDVYLAYDPKLDRRVALKLMNERAASPTMAARFAREAQAVARLSHPNVVAIYDAGEFGGRVYLAMEFVEGQTLAEWLAAGPRTWREVRDVFTAAGRGLTAAHEAGLVHRDFKPQNVMVGRDGAVRVTDFGLAADAGDLEDGQAAATSEGVAPELTSHTLALTRTGVLLGTPLYMAPEQLLGKKTDARTDQFSFCVSLFEAVYAERPFPSQTLSALTEAVVGGRIREPNAKTRAPSFLRRLLLRGLAVDPTARFASMGDLLEELAFDPLRRRRAIALGLVAAAVAAAALVGGQRFVTRGQRICHSGADKLGGIWELDAHGERREAIHRAFLFTGRPAAEETWTRVSVLLDDYARRWTANYTDACEATHVRGDQSPEVLDLRMTCLEGPRQALKALTEVLAGANATVLVEAVNAARSLPPLDRCADVPTLKALVPPPDETSRARVSELRVELAKVKALTDTGQWTEARRRAEPLIDRASAVGYEPLRAEALAALGWLQSESGDTAESAKTLEETVWSALAAHRDDLAAESAAMLLGDLGYALGRQEDGKRWARAGRALLQRLGPGHDRIASWFSQAEGTLLEDRAEPAAALAAFHQALALKRKTLPPDDPDIAMTLHDIANVQNSLGHYSAALDTANSAIEIYRKTYGDGVPLLAEIICIRGEALTHLGRYDEAERDLRGAVDDLIARLGPDHRWTAYPLTALGKLLVAERRWREAASVLHRALQIREHTELNPTELGETQFALAQASWEIDRKEARRMALAAREDYRKVPSRQKDVAEIDRWLADR
jgi:tetratricopeptide (TPR) repeat protein